MEVNDDLEHLISQVLWAVQAIHNQFLCIGSIAKLD